MTYHEFTGKTVKEAIRKACDELDVDEALLEIQVLEESTRGFLGLVGQRDARIRARKRDILKEVMEAEETPPPEPKKPSIPAAVAPTVKLAPAPKAVPDPVEEPEEDFPSPKSEDVPPPPPSPQLQSARDNATSVLRDILEKMQVEADVEARTDNGAVCLDIKGDGSGLLIGKKGQTLNALQFLVSKIVNRDNSPDDRVEVVVDTENYRLRAHEKLKDMALKTSTKAKRTLKPASLNPMPAHERRIVHLILAEDREVYTKSYGDGPMRRIIVYPRRGSQNKRRGR